MLPLTRAMTTWISGKEKKPSVLLHPFKNHISNSDAGTKVYVLLTLYFFPQLEILLKLSPKLST